MTIETRTTIEMRDIKTVEFECGTCHTKLVYDIDKFTNPLMFCNVCQPSRTLVADRSSDLQDIRHFIATAFENPHDCGLVFAASGSNSPLVLFLVHIARLAADESLVHFDFATGTTQLDERAGLHRKANPVQHEPCGLLGDAKSAGHFVGTDSVFAIGNHPNSDKPLVQRQRRILKDSPDFDRELPFGVDALALPLALILEEHGVLAATSGADHDAIWPAQLDHELEAVIGIREMDDCLLEGSGLFHCFDLNPEYPRPIDLSSILLPLADHCQVNPVF